MIWFVTAALIAADQLTKVWAASSLPLGRPGLTLGWGFHLTYVQNSGAAFGILQDATLALAVLSGVVALVIAVYLRRHASSLPALQLWALALILSGAIGNLIDRIRLGYVIDFIHFSVPGFDFPVFNIADACVVVGAGLLILASLRKTPPHPVEPKRLDKAEGERP
jgi:signal peptidase II